MKALPNPGETDPSMLEMRGATSDHPNWGAAWRQADFDLVKSLRFREFLRAQNFTLVKWKDLGRARVNQAR